MAGVETILIVGGGIAGLTLGRPLHRQGCRVELVERSPIWRAGGGIAVQPDGMRTLRALGLDGGVAAIEQQIARRAEQLRVLLRARIGRDIRSSWPARALRRPATRKIPPAQIHVSSGQP